MFGLGFQRIARRAVGAAWSPSQLGPLLWLRADAAQVTLTGSDVDTWADLSASGADFEGPSGIKPQWTASDADFNGHGSITFVPGDRLDLATLDALTSASLDHTFVVVHKSATANDSSSHVIFNCGETPYSTPTNLSFYWGFGGANDLGALTGGAGAVATGSTQTTAVRYDTWQLDDGAGTLEVFEDGVSAGTGAYSSGNRLDSTTAGRIGSDVDNIRHYSGKIAELLYFDSALSSGDLAKLWAYIEARYAL